MQWKEEDRMNQKDKQVLEMINMKKMVTTGELCELFGYSESTARRTLQRLSDRGMIQRYHGGAMSNKYKVEQEGIQHRFEQQSQEKDRIARHAVEQIRPGSTIVMLGGTTVYKMCKYLQGMKITIITNSMLVFEELKSNPRTNIILLGGRYNYVEEEVRGVLTNTNLKLLRADALFTGATEFHPHIGFMTGDIESVELYRLCIEAVNRTFVLADSSKLGEGGAAVMAVCQMIDCLITDTGLLDMHVAGFEEQGVKVCRV